MDQTQKLCINCNNKKSKEEFHRLIHKRHKNGSIRIYEIVDNICQHCFDRGARSWKVLRDRAKNDEFRICSKCGNKKSTKLFGKGSNWHRCLDCYNKYNRSYYHQDVKKAREKQAAVRRGLNRGEFDAAKWMRLICRFRAKREGIPFSLEKEDIVIPVMCPVLKIKLTTPGKGVCENSPTIDRIDSKKGYIKENIAVISMRANRLKNNATISEIEQILAWMKSVGAP